MSAWAAAAAAGSVAAAALASRRLATTPVSGPMVLVAAGLACGPGGLTVGLSFLLHGATAAWAASRYAAWHAVAAAADADLREGPAEPVPDPPARRRLQAKDRSADSGPRVPG